MFLNNNSQIHCNYTLINKSNQVATHLSTINIVIYQLLINSKYLAVVNFCFTTFILFDR